MAMVLARMITEQEIEELESVEKRLTGKKEYRRLQSVLIRAKLGKSAIEIGAILNIHPRTVEKHHERYFEEGMATFSVKKPGSPSGNRLTSVEAEKSLFKTLEEKAKTGEWLKAAQIKPLYEAVAGRVVALSTIYNVLQRNRWSKQRPRPKHPKGDPEKQELFKKTTRNHSVTCSIR
jgi:transposase